MPRPVPARARAFPRRRTVGRRRLNADIRATQEALERHGYVAEPTIATAVFLARTMRKPLLVEGDAGVGKTELAKVLARMLDTELIRLQCYEGLDVHTALYEWNYQRQLLRLRIQERPDQDPGRLEELIFGRDYLLERPLLRAITRAEGAPVLLVDEVDRADDGFEAFLLEVLSDFQVTIPELGTIRAQHIPYVVLTSNRTREIGDALRRRCLYLYIEHPTLEKEIRIIHARVPEAAPRLADQVGRFVQALRARPLAKPPGVAETLDWTRALVTLHRDSLDAETVEQTLGCVLKDRNDQTELAQTDLTTLVAAAAAPGTE
ncbi:MAG TPA: MoxR family ATPase [Gemmatimonadales bacterium]|nr:MoxR family ATPase [Gemmatimonadales bacterium]